jgi:hypothetical protein
MAREDYIETYSGVVDIGWGWRGNCKQRWESLDAVNPTIHGSNFPWSQTDMHNQDYV